MFEDEAIVWQVSVEGADDVVAIGVGVRVGVVAIEDRALRVGVARDVEPVAAPAFTIARRGEQLLDDFFKGIGRSVRFEGFDFVERGRQTGEIEIGAANQGSFVGGR